MTPSRRVTIGHWLKKRAENVIVVLIALMFISFLLQIAFRYVLNRPLGWTDEVTVLCWVWVVLWGAAFILSDQDEIRFDIVSSKVPESARRAFTVISSVVLVVLFVLSLPATWNYVLFMKREKSAYLGMRFDFLYSIYVVFALAILGLPIGLSMICASIFYLIVAHLDLGTAAEQILNGLFNSYVLLAVPLFILAADLMNSGSLTDRLLKFCLVLVGRFRGGLGHVNVVANIIFAGMSGSAIADAVGIGRIIIGMMTRDGKYPVAYAAAITASSAIIGPIIPPSIPMVVYALVSDTSIGYLFLGGVIPGLMLGLGFMVTNTVIARRRNYPVEPPMPLREIPRITLRAFPALMLPVILLFGIYGGVMTPTEGAASAAFYALLASTLLYRAVSWRQLYEAILTSGKATTSIGMLIVGALVFNYVVTIENVPGSLAKLLAGYQLSATGFLRVVTIILLILGCLLEGSTILLVVVPIFIPTAKALGIDLVHFGVVVVVNIMIGLLTPPYGLLLFVLANMTKQPLTAIVREAVPFVVLAIVVLALITMFPESILWLPRVFGYKG